MEYSGFKSKSQECVYCDGGLKKWCRFEDFAQCVGNIIHEDTECVMCASGNAAKYT